MPTETTTPRLTCDISLIDLTGILRKDPGDVSDIVDSIRDNLAKGLPALIHPVVVDSKMRLISGSRRYAAHKVLGLKEIDYAFFAVLDEGERVRLEVAANYQEPFKWQERALAVDKYHRFYSTSAILEGKDWGVRETGKILGMTRNPVSRSLIIAEYLHANDKEIWAAESMQDAFRVLIAREEKFHAAQLVAATMPKGTTQTTVASIPVITSKIADVTDDDFFAPLDGKQGGFTPAVSGPITTDERPGQKKVETVSPVPVIPLSSMLFKSAGPRDLSIMENMGADSTDHIICDPPFGVVDHMDMIDQQNVGSDTSSVAQEHVAEETMLMMQDFRPLAVRNLREGGFLVMWCDPTHWWSEACLFESLGLTIQRWPLVWLKTSSCSNGQAYKNFTKNIEFALVARKGPKAALVVPQKSSVWTGGNDMETKLLGHPFAKPFGLWEWAMKAVCQRGAEVLDPFVGKGSSMLPAIDLGLRPRGIECNEDHYNGLVFNIQQKYKSLDSRCTFS